MRVTVRWRELESNLAYIMPRTEHASNVPMPFGMSIFCVDATDCSANFYSGVEDVTVVTIDEEKKVVGGGEKIKMCGLVYKRCMHVSCSLTGSIFCCSEGQRYKHNCKSADLCPVC